MDREANTWPGVQWEIQDPIGSTELIFGTGDLFRTGAAGAKGTLEEQHAHGNVSKGPMGPSATDFQKIVQGSQGSMGIATWVSLRCQTNPSIQKPYLVGSKDLDSLISFVYPVQRNVWGEHSFVLNRTALAMLMTYNDPTSFSKVRNTLPDFICLQNIAGFEILPKERIKYQEEGIKNIAAGAGLSLEPKIGSVSADQVLATATKPCGEKDWRHVLKGNCLSIISMTTLDRTPDFITVFEACASKNGTDRDDIGVYIQPLVQNHSVHVEFMVPYDAAEVEKMRSLETEAVHALNTAHAFFNRPYGTAEKIVFANNPTNTRLLKTVKGIFDPNRVLNPGKFGLLAEHDKEVVAAMSILTKYDLDDAQRKALEDIVGARYVSTEPCVRDAYTVYHSSSAINKQNQVYAPRPAAVYSRSRPRRLPGSSSSATRTTIRQKPFPRVWLSLAARAA